MLEEENKFKLKSILISLNKEFSLDDFCDLLEKETNGRMTFTNLKEILEKTYPKTNRQDKLFFLKQVNYNIKTGLIHIFDLFEFISMNLDNKIVSPIYTFYLTARLIEKFKKTTTLEFVYKCSLILHSEININEFYKTITASLELDDLSSVILFKSLDYNKTGKIRVEDFIFLIDSYRDDFSFQGDSEKSNDILQTEIKEERNKLRNLLAENYLTVNEIFKRLTVNNLNYVEYNQLQKFLKVELNKENNFEIDRTIEISLDSIVRDYSSVKTSISQAKIFNEDFEKMIFDAGRGTGDDDNGTNKVANANSGNNNNLAKIKLNDVQLYWINKYLVLLESINLTDKMAFDVARESKTNLLNLENLRRKLKLMLPVGKISALDLNSVIEALDVNKKRYLTQSDYEEIVNTVKNGKLARSEKETKKSTSVSASNNKSLLGAMVKNSKSVNFHLLPIKGNHKVIEQLKLEISRNYNPTLTLYKGNTSNSTKEKTSQNINQSINKKDSHSKLNKLPTLNEDHQSFTKEENLQATNLINQDEYNLKEYSEATNEEKNEIILIETLENFTFLDHDQEIFPTYNLYEYAKTRLLDGAVFNQKRISEIIRKIDKNKDGLITYYDIIEYLLYEYKHRSTKLSFKSIANKIYHETKMKTDEFFLINGIDANKELTVFNLCETLSKLFKFDAPINKKIYEEMRIVFSHKKNKLKYNDLIELIDEVKFEDLMKNEINSAKNFSNTMSSLDLKQFEEGIRTFVNNLVDLKNYNNYMNIKRSSNPKQLSLIFRENLKCACNMESSSIMNLQQFKENFIRPLKLDINLGIAVFQLLKNFSHKNEQIITSDDLILFLESYLDQESEKVSLFKKSNSDETLRELVRNLENSGSPLSFVFDNIPYIPTGIVTCTELVKIMQEFYPSSSKSFLKNFIIISDLDQNKLGYIEYKPLQQFLMRVNELNGLEFNNKPFSLNLEYKIMASAIDIFHSIRINNSKENSSDKNQEKQSTSNKDFITALDYFSNLSTPVNNPDSVKKQEHLVITQNLCSNKATQEGLFDYLCSISGDTRGYNLIKLCELIDYHRTQVDILVTKYDQNHRDYHADPLYMEEISDIINDIKTELNKNKKSIIDSYLENLKLDEDGYIPISKLLENLNSSLIFLDAEKIQKFVESMDIDRHGKISYFDFHQRMKNYFGVKYLGNLPLNARYIFSHYIKTEYEGNIEDFLLSKLSDENLKQMGNLSNTFNICLTKENFSNYFIEYFMNDLDLFNQFYLINREREGKNKDFISLQKLCNYLKENNRDRIKTDDEEIDSELNEEIFHLFNQIEEDQTPLKNIYDFLTLTKIGEDGEYSSELLSKIFMDKLSVIKEDVNKILQMFNKDKNTRTGSEVDLVKMAEYILKNCEKSETKIQEISAKIKNAIRRYNITQFETFLKRFSMKGNFPISIKEIATGFPPIFRISIFECFVIFSHCRNLLKIAKKEKVTIDYIFDSLNLKEIFLNNENSNIAKEKCGNEAIDSSLKLCLMRLNEYLEKVEAKDKVEVFRKFDSDKNGVLSTEEFLNALNSFSNLKLNDSQKISLLKIADKDLDGRINYTEFLRFLKFVKNEISNDKPNVYLKPSNQKNLSSNRKVSFIPKIEIDYKKFKINYENNLRRLDPKSSDKFSNLLFILQEDFFINFNNYENIEKDFNAVDQNQAYLVDENDFVIALKKRLLRIDAETISKFVEFANSGLNQSQKKVERNLINYKNFLLNLANFKYIPSDEKQGIPENVKNGKSSLSQSRVVVPPPNPPKKIITNNTAVKINNMKSSNVKMTNIQQYDEFGDAEENFLETPGNDPEIQDVLEEPRVSFKNTKKLKNENIAKMPVNNLENNSKIKSTNQKREIKSANIKKTTNTKKISIRQNEDEEDFNNYNNEYIENNRNNEVEDGINEVENNVNKTNKPKSNIKTIPQIKKNNQNASARAQTARQKQKISPEDEETLNKYNDNLDEFDKENYEDYENNDISSKIKSKKIIASADIDPKLEIKKVSKLSQVNTKRDSNSRVNSKLDDSETEIKSIAAKKINNNKNFKKPIPEEITENEIETPKTKIITNNTSNPVGDVLLNKDKKKLIINKKKHYDLPKIQENTEKNSMGKIFLGNIGSTIDLSDEKKMLNMYHKMLSTFSCTANSNIDKNELNNEKRDERKYTAEEKQNFQDFLTKINNLDYKGYEYTINPSEDYYKRYGTETVETILNSEDAAIKKCEDIYKGLKDGEYFFDKDFGSQPKDNGMKNKFSLYITGAPPKGGIDPLQIEWYKMSEISQDTPAKFIDDGIETNDVMQGAIGDCWFISALAVLATKDHLLRGEFNPSILHDGTIDNEENIMLSTGVFPPIFQSFRMKGIFCLRFYKDFKWRYVIVDDRLPCKKIYSKSQAPKLIYGKCRSESEFWVPLIEKAYAKLHGSYESLISGFIDDGLVDLTGLVARKYMINPEERKNPKSIDDLWKIIKSNCTSVLKTK